MRIKRFPGIIGWMVYCPEPAGPSTAHGEALDRRARPIKCSPRSARLADEVFDLARHPGAYRVFAYAGDDTLLGHLGNLRSDTIYSSEASDEFLGFATDGLPLIQGLTIEEMRGLGGAGTNRIDNLQFGLASDLVPVPEPSTYAAGAIVLLAGAVGLRSRRRSVVESVKAS